MSPVASRAVQVVCALSLSFIAVSKPASAADLNWKGFDWKFTNGDMAGEAAGAGANISVDANGYLHLRITKTGNTWTASELFTTQKLGFGTYQWHIEGPVDTFDKNNVLGLFPYGPAAGIGVDGTNEIDIEFARWGYANGDNADFADYPNSGTEKGVTSFKISLGGSTSSTARFVWNSSSIESSILKGHQPVASDDGLLKKWKYAPNNSGVNIPQRAMPLGMNLWCFGAPPSDGKNVEIVIRDFQFIKEGDPLPSNGGAGGTSAGGAASGGSSASGGSPGGGTGSDNGGSAGSSEPASGGNAANGAGTGTGGATVSAGGAPSGSAGVPSASTAGATATTAGTANASPDDSNADAGCACQLAGGARSPANWSALLGLTLLVLRRRRFLDHLGAR